MAIYRIVAEQWENQVKVKETILAATGLKKAAQLLFGGKEYGTKEIRNRRDAPRKLVVKVKGDPENTYWVLRHIGVSDQASDRTYRIYERTLDGRFVGVATEVDARRAELALEKALTKLGYKPEQVHLGDYRHKAAYIIGEDRVFECVKIRERNMLHETVPDSLL